MFDVEMQLYDDFIFVLIIVVVDLDFLGNEYSDEEEDIGGVDEEVVCKLGDVGEQKRGSDSKEEVGEVIEEGEKIFLVDLVKYEDVVNDELYIGGEGEVDGEGEEVEEEEEKR